LFSFSCWSFCCVCVACLWPFFSFVFIVPIVRCHALCCSAHVRSELFLLMRFFFVVCGFVVLLIARVRCVSNVQVRVFRRISVQLTRRCVWPLVLRMLCCTTCPRPF
jgi:hypothetical protein